MRKNSMSMMGALATVAVAASAMASATTIYNSISGEGGVNVLDGSYLSLGFQATQTAEFGDRITFGGTARTLQTATFTMVNWARYEDYNAGGQYYGSGQWAGNGFNHSFTLNLYEAGTGSSPGALITSITQTKFITYRPTGWSFNGYAQNISFDLSAQNITVPNSVVWGLAYNTQSYGSNPLGVSGPYNSLNMGLNDYAAGGVSVGSTDLDKLFWKTSTAGNYTDGGAAGVNVFRQ
ncbi:MAG: hypothetical protein EBQ99_09450, partial [Planctomycetes bacterium]|nr:hypothetical protein [Planctomycetota bacterium]